MNQTPPGLIYTVVFSIALLAMIGVVSLCASLFLHTYADPAILTAIISTTSLLVGALVALLSNPRSPVMSTTTTTGVGGATTTTTQPTATPVVIAPVTNPTGANLVPISRPVATAQPVTQTQPKI